LEQRFLQQEVLLPNQSKAAELAHTTSKAAINLLKQAMCSMQPTDQLADTTSTLHMNNTTENIFVQNSIENGNSYKTIEYGRSNRR
ncbi:MAG TPA: hypothetical protein VK133_03170, partial [Amoebophilaceae bacterium]|nr:hypothetical protein [Amoebophilaceae bacterium]